MDNSLSMPQQLEQQLQQQQHQQQENVMANNNTGMQQQQQQPQNYHVSANAYTNGQDKNYMPTNETIPTAITILPAAAPEQRSSVALTFISEGTSGSGTWTTPFSGVETFLTHDQFTSALTRINNASKIDNTWAKKLGYSAVIMLIIGFILFGLLGYMAVSSSGGSPSPFIGFILFFAGMVTMVIAGRQGQIAYTSMTSAMNRTIAELNNENPYAKWEYTMALNGSNLNRRRGQQTHFQVSPATLCVGPTGYQPRTTGTSNMATTFTVV